MKVFHSHTSAFFAFFGVLLFVGNEIEGIHSIHTLLYAFDLYSKESFSLSLLFILFFSLPHVAHYEHHM